MSVKLKAPSGATVDAPDEQAARLCAFGFSKVEEPKAKPKTRARSKKAEAETDTATQIEEG